MHEVDGRGGQREPGGLPRHHRPPGRPRAFHQRGVGLDAEHRAGAVEEAQVVAVAAADVADVAPGPRRLLAQRGPDGALDVLRGVLLRVDLGPVPDVRAGDTHTGTSTLSAAQATNAVGSSESSRSSTPPWPGSRLPM